MTTAPRPATGHDTLDAVIDHAVQARRLPGVAAALTDAGDTVYSGAAGVRALGGDRPMTTDTVCFIASMTKPLTATAAMQLVERGRLSLDRPASEVLPAIGKLRVLQGFDDQDTPITRPPKRPITLRHLLTHSDGSANEAWSPPLRRCLAGSGDPNSVERYRASLFAPLTADPGDRWQYGTGIDWAGRLVEAVSGLTLEEYMHRHLLEPLGMSSTGYRPSGPAEQRRASVHQRQPDGSLVATGFVAAHDPDYPRGGGGLYSTVEDYLKFVRLLLNGGRADSGQALLQPVTVSRMMRCQSGPLRVTRMRTANPARSCDAEFFPGIEKCWGFGLMINLADAPTGRSAGSAGWAGIANTFFWVDPTAGLGGVFMSQLLPFVDPDALGAFTAFETAAYRQWRDGGLSRARG